MKIIWTPRAVRNLEAIHKYIGRDSVSRANEMIARVLARSEQLVEFPQSGRMVREYNRADLRELIEPPYRIIYRLRTEAVDVVAVVHSSQKLR